MAVSENVGRNVQFLYNLPYERNGYDNFAGNGNFKDFEKQLKAKIFKYVFAITANDYQLKAGRMLKKNGFKDHFTFYSSHGDHENLTLWYKINKKFKNDDKNPEEPNIGNCSVTFDRDYKTKLNLTIQGKRETSKSLKNSGFIQLEKTPIWFKIKKSNIVNKRFKFPTIAGTDLPANINEWTIVDYLKPKRAKK